MHLIRRRGGTATSERREWAERIAVARQAVVRALDLDVEHRWAVYAVARTLLQVAGERAAVGWAATDDEAVAALRRDVDGRADRLLDGLIDMVLSSTPSAG